MLYGLKDVACKIENSDYDQYQLINNSSKLLNTVLTLHRFELGRRVVAKWGIVPYVEQSYEEYKENSLSVIELVRTI